MRLAIILGFVALAARATDGQAASPREILADLDTRVPRALADWRGAGIAIGIVQNDSLIYAKGFGVREVGKQGAVDERTLFAIGSNTKFFTAVAAGMLADDGKLSLDDKVTKHLPWFELYDPWVTREFTLRDAMSHRSGLGRRGDPLWYGTSHSREEILRRVRLLAPNSSFRSEYGYQNIMFLAAGQAIGAAAGVSWDDVIATRIFQPLGMTVSNTSVRRLAGLDNVAGPHALTGSAPRPSAIPWRDIDNIAPAGAINSNVQDMARWMRFVLAGGKSGGRQLLKAATLAQLTAPHAISGRVVNDTLNPTRHFSLYGLGIGISDLQGVKVLTHTGGIDGMLSYVAMVPERGLGIVVLTNVSGHNALYTAIGHHILNAFLGGPSRDWSAIFLADVTRQERVAADSARARLSRRVGDTKPSRPLEEYAGTYRHEMYGDALVTLDGGTLRVRFHNALDVRLSHVHFDTFTGGTLLMADDGNNGTRVRFTLNAAGRVDGVDVEGIAIFGRVP